MDDLFAKNPQIKVPSVHSKFSTVRKPSFFHPNLKSRVLTMEFVDGIPVDNLDAIKEGGISPYEVGHLLNDCFCKQIFEKGIVHGDPHSGNIFASKDAKGKT